MENTKEQISCIPTEKNSLLIAEVKKFPSLYDTSDPNYYVLAERNKAWLQVAESCNEPAELCHLRWKSLRKRYAKEKRRFPDILQGHRRPWALFPKMSFLTPSTSKRRVRPIKPRRNFETTSVSFETSKQNASDDDMLIVDDNDEIVRTCKSTEMSEEDEYIYETLDDPDSALEIMKEKPPPKTKPTAIRSGVSASAPVTVRSSCSGRIRKLTPKMQNSIIAKKLKQAQQILQQSNGTIEGLNQKPPNVDKISTLNKNVKKSVSDNTTRHVATVNPNVIRVENVGEKEDFLHSYLHEKSVSLPCKIKSDLNNSEESRPFKVIKLKGRNPVIFSPEQYPSVQPLLKSDNLHSHYQEQKTPLIKVKSVDNLNNQNNQTLPKTFSDDNNLDIIHSVGLIRRNSTDNSLSRVEYMPNKKSFEKINSNYSRSYSWNKSTEKVAKKQTSEKIQPDSQTNDFVIEETWNDIKEERIDDVDANWPNTYEAADQVQQNPVMDYQEIQNKTNIWNKLNDAKLELVAYQRKLLEEQHKKNMEYMKKEHDLKMTLLKAEIDLKRKQLNIML